MDKKTPYIETIGGQSFVVLTDMAKYLRFKKYWPCNSKPLNAGDFEIMFTTDEIRQAHFSRNPKGTAYILNLKTETYGEEKYLIGETPNDIIKTTGIQITINN